MEEIIIPTTIRDKTSDTVSIGVVARACNISVETLRNWESRYGFPEPERLDSGHRRYRMEIIPRLKKIKRLVDMGYRPSLAVAMDESDIDELLRGEGKADLEHFAPLSLSDDWMKLWMDNVARMDGDGLKQQMETGWSLLGGKRFVLQQALTFLTEVGRRWERGEMSVGDEHFSSEIMQSFLCSKWRALNVATGSKIILANPEGHFHALGIHMAAVLATLNGIQPLFLGPNTPFASIVTAARAQQVHCVVIGLSRATDVNAAKTYLEDLHSGMAEIQLVYGGNARMPELAGIAYIPSLEEFDHWCRRLKH